MNFSLIINFLFYDPKNNNNKWVKKTAFSNFENGSIDKVYFT